MQTVGVYRIEAAHAAALDQLLRGGPAGTDAIARELDRLGAATFLAARIAEREGGAGHTFSVSDQYRLLGLCDLRGLVSDRATFDVWIAPPFRRRGHGSLALRMMLEFAFVNMRLAVVVAQPPDIAALALLAKNGFRGFRLGAGSQPCWIDPARWRHHRDTRVLVQLTPSLRTLLDAELTGGNEIAETGTGRPDADSVFVRLRRPFCARPKSLPAGVDYQELNDPHWWHAEYHSRNPRHLLVY
jgi:RimJ/RimL family protein N-acetyltransferase